MTRKGKNKPQKIVYFRYTCLPIRTSIPFLPELPDPHLDSFPAGAP
jgi:hypothetical protein